MALFRAAASPAPCCSAVLAAVVPVTVIKGESFAPTTRFTLFFDFASSAADAALAILMRIVGENLCAPRSSADKEYRVRSSAPAWFANLVPSSDTDRI